MKRERDGPGRSFYPCIAATREKRKGLSSVGARGRLVLLAIRTTIADDRRQAGSYGFGVHMRLSGGVT
ncbi:conserved hypothetical protein [Stutzerimonas stutzeri A1501]|uniref:Uncharacterized protein n=1 Tax=Stutzerimonas stutzeri (strain A1501) TaxID=379731 RepID=A4VJE3_STUS1|nr:conserved hypothetical protein [Stutzerimonas stutzeri A1501]